MRTDFLPFSRPSITEADIAAVADVLRSGWITTGPQNAELEDRFRAFTGCRGATCVSSATAGMHIALQALGIGPGDEVITPSMTWVSTVNLIVLAGAKPVFVDVDRDTLMVNADRIAEKITDRTRLVIPVHFAGAPADMDPIRRLADRHGLALIEDAAHAIGTEYKGVRVGRTGTSIFSFHPIKNITTGEGGMVCSEDPDFDVRMRRLKFHGLGVDAYDRRTQGRSPQAEVIEPGFKYNLPDILAVLGLRQLDRVDAMNAQRTLLAETYLEKLRRCGRNPPPGPAGLPHEACLAPLYRKGSVPSARNGPGPVHGRPQSAQYRHRHAFPGRAPASLLPGDLSRGRGHASRYGMELGAHLLAAPVPGYDPGRCGRCRRRY